MESEEMDTNLDSPTTEINQPRVNATKRDLETGESSEGLSRNSSQVNLLERDDLRTSNLETAMHILKGNIGTGILAIPEALKYAGLTFGTVGIAVISVLCIHSMHLLLKTARILYKRIGTTALDYSEVTEYTFKTGPPAARKFSRAFRAMTDTFLIITQLGFCCVYIIFVSNNFLLGFSFATTSLTLKQYMGILLPFFIVLNFVRNLKYLAILSTIANLLQVTSMGIIFYHLFQDIPDPASRTQIAEFDRIPLWFGTVIFAFEGISLVLPLENNMKRPQDFGGWTGVLNTSMCIVTSFYIGIGFFGYLKYGDTIQASVTLNLPEGTVLARIVQISYGIAIFFSYALQFYVPIKVLWTPIKERIPISRYHLPLEYAFRTLVVLFTFTLAFAIPKLGLFISLVGSFSGSYLALIMPPILHCVTLYVDGRLHSWICVKNILISLVGILGLVTGTYISIKEIVDDFSKDAAA